MLPARTALAAALVLFLAVAAPAAEAAKRPKSAKYNLIIKGTQVTTWDYQKKQAPSCDWPESAGGEQKIRFFIGNAEPKVPVKVVAEGKGVAIEPTRVEMAADAVMKADWRRLFTQQSECGGGGVFGGDGGGPPKDDIGSASCVALGQIDLLMGTSRDELYQPGDPLRIPGPDPKSSVIMRGVPMWDSGDSYRTLPGQCSVKEGEPNADIGITVSRGEWAGGLIEFVPKLSPKKLLVKNPRKKVVVKGKETISYPNAIQTEQPNDVTTGKTTLEYTFTFVPRKK